MLVPGEEDDESDEEDGPEPAWMIHVPTPSRWNIRERGGDGDGRGGGGRGGEGGREGGGDGGGGGGCVNKVM